jgi:hypothetical protein
MAQDVDKSDLLRRVETLINNPEEFRVRKKMTRNGKSQNNGWQYAKASPFCSATAKCRCKLTRVTSESDAKVYFPYAPLQR